MIAADLISEAAAAGLCLQAVGNDRLKCTSKGPPPPDLLARLRDRKADLIAELRAEDHRDHSVDDAPRWREAFEERAAIREHCGGVPRAEAEAAALNDLASIWRSENSLPASDRAACCHCGKPDPCTPVLAANGYAWLHRECWAPMNTAREKLAREAIIKALGISDASPSKQPMQPKEGAMPAVPEYAAAKQPATVRPECSRDLFIARDFDTCQETSTFWEKADEGR